MHSFTWNKTVLIPFAKESQIRNLPSGPRSGVKRLTCVHATCKILLVYQMEFYQRSLSSAGKHKPCSDSVLIHKSMCASNDDVIRLTCHQDVGCFITTLIPTSTLELVQNHFSSPSVRVNKKPWCSDGRDSHLSWEACSLMMERREWRPLPPGWCGRGGGAALGVWRAAASVIVPLRSPPY